MLEGIILMLAGIMFITLTATTIITCVYSAKRDKISIKEFETNIEEAKQRIKLIKQQMKDEKGVQKKKRSNKDEIK